MITIVDKRDTATVVTLGDLNHSEAFTCSPPDGRYIVKLGLSAVTLRHSQVIVFSSGLKSPVFGNWPDTKPVVKVDLKITLEVSNP